MSRKLALWLALLAAALPAPSAAAAGDFYQRGTFTLDWYGSRAEDGTFFNQVSARFRLDLISRPGSGWTLALDGRDRIGLAASTRNQVILYALRLTYDSPGSRFYLSAGQLNLYDTAGIGQLLGGLAGVKIGRDVLAGGYGGFESTPYVDRLESNYLKFGAFLRWTGSRGKSAAVSFNQLSYAGRTERRYAYGELFLPIERLLVVYGDVEYELGPHTETQNRLSRVFANARLDIGRWADLTGTYSSGRGLDYHRFLIEAALDPSLSDRNVERFYYTNSFGARLSLKPAPTVRLSVSRQQSEQADLNVLNHTWRFSAAAWNLFGKGISVTGDYALNRGDMAESDSWYASLAKDFGRVSLQASYANTFNAVRFDSEGGTPSIVHLNDYRNVDLSAFVHISRAVMVSVEYDYFLQSPADRHYFFARLIFRTY